VIFIPNFEEVTHDDEVVAVLKGLCPGAERVDVV
jgi:hypothetical protein